MDQTSGTVSESTVSIFPGEDIILKVRDLHTYFFTDIGIARALNGVNFDIPRGKVMGMVGESGCGKSVTALSIMRMVTTPGRIVQGDITMYRKKKGADGKEPARRNQPDQAGRHGSDDAQPARQRDVDDLPGAHDLAQPVLHHRRPDHGSHHPASKSGCGRSRKERHCHPGWGRAWRTPSWWSNATRTS
jgi:hypothetical protein